MSNDLVSNALLRRFLLGKVDSDQRALVERLFITGTLTNETLIAAEEELIDDYLDGELDSEEAASFLSQYSHTPTEQRNLKIAALIKAWTKTESDVRFAQTGSRSGFGNVRYRMKVRNRWTIPIAIAASVVVVAIAVWSIRDSEEPARIALLERQVQQLNDLASAKAMPVKTSVTLSPISVRSAERQTEIIAPTEFSIVELQLLWIQKPQFSNYQAIIRRVGYTTSIVVRSLKVEVNDGTTVHLLLPTGVLARGSYRIELSGIDADGDLGASDDYGFVVLNQ